MLGPTATPVRRHPALVRRRLAVGAHVVDVRGTFDPALPPVVLVHGIGVSGQYFLRLADELAPTRDVYALDLPGYGTTPGPRRALSVPELADVVAGTIGVLGLEAPVVVGHSMGCQVVVEALRSRPGLCAAYVLLGPTTDPDARSLVAMGARLLLDTLREPPATNAVIFRDYARMGPRRYLRTARSMLRHRIETGLRECTVPGLIGRGEKDPIAPRNWVRRLAAAAPDAVLLEIPGAPHAVQHTHPGQLVAACAGVLARPPVATAASAAPGPYAPATTGPGLLAEAGANLSAWLRDYAYAARGQATGLLARPDPRRYRRPADPGGSTVVLIPGVYESWAFLLPVARMLREHGHDVHVVPSLRYNTGTIEEMARLVDEHIRSEGLERCVLVAHSKGGLIGKQLLAHHNPRTVIQGLVAVNTPFAGSALARLLPLPAIRVFLPHSPTLTALTASHEVNRDIVSVYGLFDPHIPGGSRLEGARNVQLETRGHFLPLSDPRVHQAILDGVRSLARR